ncbi:MAG: DUF1559 domain-containing protein [Gemmataceae bacterium]
MHHDTHKTFPAGQTGPTDIFSGPRHLWIIYILPYIEQGPLYNSYNFAAGFRGPSYQSVNGAFLQKVVPLLRCPSDSAGVFSGEWANDNVTRINYVACFSADGTQVEPGADYNDNPGGAFNNAANNPSVTSGKRAIFNINVKRGMKSVTDGTSNTLMLSELIAGRSGSLDLRGPWSSELCTYYTHYRTPNTSVKDSIWSSIPQYCIDQPDVPCSANAPSFGTMNLSARSRHTGGVNACAIDGSVRFVTNGIDPAAWQALGSIAGGEVANLTN